MRLSRAKMPLAIEDVPDRFTITVDDRDTQNDWPAAERFDLPTVREYLLAATSVLIFEHDVRSAGQAPQEWRNLNTFRNAVADAVLRGGLAVLIMTDRSRLGFWEAEVREWAGPDVRPEVLANNGRWQMKCTGAG